MLPVAEHPPRLLQLDGHQLPAPATTWEETHGQWTNLARQERARRVKCLGPSEARAAISAGWLPAVQDDDTRYTAKRPKSGDRFVALVYASRDNQERALVVYKTVLDDLPATSSKALREIFLSKPVQRSLDMGDKAPAAAPSFLALTLNGASGSSASLPQPVHELQQQELQQLERTSDDGVASSVNSVVQVRRNVEVLAAKRVLEERCSPQERAERIERWAQITAEMSCEAIHGPAPVDEGGPHDGATEDGAQRLMELSSLDLRLDNDELGLFDDAETSRSDRSDRSSRSSRLSICSYSSAGASAGASSGGAGAAEAMVAFTAPPPAQTEVCEDITSAMSKIHLAAAPPPSYAVSGYSLNDVTSTPDLLAKLSEWHELSDDGDDPELRFLLVISAGEVIAFASYFGVKGWHGTGKGVFIHDLGVTSQCQREGLGMQLVDRLVHAASLADCDVVAASCVCSNTLGCNFWVIKAEFRVAAHGFDGRARFDATMDVFKPLNHRSVNIASLPMFEIKKSEAVYTALRKNKKTHQEATERSRGYFVREDVAKDQLITKFHIGMPLADIFETFDDFVKAKGKSDYVMRASKNGPFLDACAPTSFAGAINTGGKVAKNNAKLCPDLKAGTVNIRASRQLRANEEVFIPYRRIV